MKINKNNFARNNGFDSYLEMLAESKIVFDNGIIRWVITPTELGFLAWVDNHLDKPLGYFDTMELAMEEIMDVHNLKLFL